MTHTKSPPCLSPQTPSTPVLDLCNTSSFLHIYVVQLEKYIHLCKPGENFLSATIFVKPPQSSSGSGPQCGRLSILDLLTGSTDLEDPHVNTSFTRQADCYGHPMAGENLFGDKFCSKQRAERLIYETRRLRVAGYKLMC